MIEWVYEFDLDRLIFHIDSIPMYHLDHMPPQDIFLEGIDFDSYGYRRCLQTIPGEYIFTANSIPPPPVEDSSLQTFRNQPNAFTPISPQELLGVAELPSPIDVVCIRATEVNVAACLRVWAGKITREVMLAECREGLSDVAVAVSLSLASIALLPIHLFSDDNPLTVERKQPDSFYWIRRHICLALATHLQHERNLEAAVSELVGEISNKSEAQGIVFGVAFSVLHCVLVRVDKTAGGSWMHSGALQFLPSFFATSPDTPGITALVRLRNLQAKDDVQFFHSLLSSVPAVDPCPSEDKTIQRANKSDILFLAPEILDQIIVEIAQPADLRNLALTSTRIMCAAIPHLQHPQVNTNLYEGIILRAVYSVSQERKEGQHQENVRDQNEVEVGKKLTWASFATTRTYNGKHCVCDVGVRWCLPTLAESRIAEANVEETNVASVAEVQFSPVQGPSNLNPEPEPSTLHLN
ncbi:hypothetical protein PHLCEN_2v2127 [Hermanssonia centrifuga]|uniref:Uncharacterized protein n=1 Tax=Hermanssonia centrifuga TaxID=98765 RepID=A0A2R6RPY6_9APHY|nr:hypothetical protein PHLCEN_2v2127 [Hermanssonia centrifuga]